MNLEQPLFQPRLQVDADGAHVANDLRTRFLVGEQQRPLAATAGRLSELRADAALAGARRPGDEHAAAAKDALATQHLVQPRDAGGNPLPGGFVIELERSDRQNRESAFANEEGVFVAAMGRAAILEHP